MQTELILLQKRWLLITVYLHPVKNSGYNMISIMMELLATFNALEISNYIMT
jgi:hypothetical protein